MKKKQKVVITGGAGFIGSHLVDAYLKNNFNVVVLDNLSTGSLANLNHKAKFIKINITQKNKLKKIICAEKPDIINHHAAQISLQVSKKKPDFDIKQNVIGTINLLEACKNLPLKKFVFASSGGAIYQDQKKANKETDFPKPDSIYGISKLSCELLIKQYHKNYQLPYLCLRYANVYGPRQKSNQEGGVVSIFLDAILNNKKVKINNDGFQTRDFVYVDDVVQANLKATKSNYNGCINIGTGQKTSINKLFNLIKKLTNSKQKKIYSSQLINEKKDSCLNIEKAKKNIQWSPSYNLKSGLNAMIKLVYKNGLSD